MLSAVRKGASFSYNAMKGCMCNLDSKTGMTRDKTRAPLITRITAVITVLIIIAAITCFCLSMRVERPLSPYFGLAILPMAGLIWIPVKISEIWIKEPPSSRKPSDAKKPDEEEKKEAV